MKLKTKNKNINFDPANLDTVRGWEDCKNNCNLDEKNKFLHICLNITSRCNLKCSYCFAQHYVRTTKDMTWETAKKAIEKFTIPNKLSIGFFGGEPLLNWELIYTIIKKYPKGKYAITSNLTNLQEDMAKEMVKANFSYIVSLEGNEKTHNLSRPGKGINSYQKTINNLSLLYNIQGSVLPCTLRSTFDNIREKLDLVRRIEFLNTFVENKIVQHISVEPATGTPLFKGLSKEDKEFYQEEYYKVAAYFLQYYREKAAFPRFHHFNYPIERILLKKGFLKKNECGAGKGYIDISTEGKVYSCHREDSEPIGNIETGIDKEKQEKWLPNTYEEKEQCKKCWVRNFCGGGCRVNALIENKDIMKPSVVECWFHKARIKAVLWLWGELTKPEILCLAQKAYINSMKRQQQTQWRQKNENRPL